MNSIRIRLFAVLMLATGAVWLSAFVWIQQSTRAEVERVLDARLAEAGQMVSSLISDRRIDVAGAATIAEEMTGLESPGAAYSHKLSCQIWSLDGTLVGRSGSAPEGQLSAQDTGFADSIVDGEEWRVYSVVNEELGVRVMVGDSHTVRDGLVRDVTTGLIVPALLILPILAGLIWLSLRRGLLPLDRLARGLAQRGAADLDPVAASALPREIRPVGTALNGLFSRVSAAREREKAFTSFAAHELKTPLAGIKTQAQVAAMASDDATRAGALARIQQGVDRTDRMVRQLLSLASVDSSEGGERTPVDVAAVLRDVVEDLSRQAAAKEVAVEIEAEGRDTIQSDPVLLTAALRNVIENAIAMTPRGSRVDITLGAAGDGLRIQVMDGGPGIAEADRAHVTDRFFRGSGARANGSGLGLAIARTAVERLGGHLRFAPREGGGEMVTLEF
ncbi:ATP-binding protein [Roseovarius sp. S1116L3]|uniref:ATP-binding protein n=1 Tax=Roseovarius roseus TaxID=3342636 RepID=UPI0037284CA3